MVQVYSFANLTLCFRRRLIHLYCTGWKVWWYAGVKDVPIPKKWGYHPEKEVLV